MPNSAQNSAIFLVKTPVFLFLRKNIFNDLTLKIFIILIRIKVAKAEFSYHKRFNHIAFYSCSLEKRALDWKMHPSSRILVSIKSWSCDAIREENCVGRRKIRKRLFVLLAVRNLEFVKVL